MGLILATPGSNFGDITIKLSDGETEPTIGSIYIAVSSGYTDRLTDGQINDLADAIASLGLPILDNPAAVADTVVSIERLDYTLTPITVT